jgi:HAE1 family hydrophobic/amphiphilic exporter-1
VSSIQNAISAAFGSAYANDFIQGGRVKRVYVQADAPYRMLPDHLNHFYVRNNTGKMVPVSALASGHWFFDSPQLERFNGFPALNFQGEPAPGRSSGEAMKAMEELTAKLPKGFGHEWTGLSYQEQMASKQTAPVFPVRLCPAECGV